MIVKRDKNTDTMHMELDCSLMNFSIKKFLFLDLYNLQYLLSLSIWKVQKKTCLVCIDSCKYNVVILEIQFLEFKILKHLSSSHLWTVS